MVVAAALVENKSGCYSSVPSRLAAMTNNNWLVPTGVAFGFGLERRNCFVPAAVQLVVFETRANCCSLAGNDFVPEIRIASGDYFGFLREPDYSWSPGGLRSACCHHD
jgi:hypothetical protein